jgi:hypothetical protein
VVVSIKAALRNFEGWCMKCGAVVRRVTCVKQVKTGVRRVKVGTRVRRVSVGARNVEVGRLEMQGKL